MQDTLLIELLTEELPPKALPKLAASLTESVSNELKTRGLITAESTVTTYASPRRLAVQITHVAAVQPDQQVERRGPAVASGFKDGNPTPALAGFARSCGVEVSALETINDGKQDVFVYRSLKAGLPLDQHLNEILPTAFKKLPAPKVMRWGAGEAQFVRPVHGLVVMLGSAVLKVAALDLQAGNSTRGHRFLSTGAVTIDHADHYAQVLENQGKVVANFEERRDRIRAALNQKAATLNSKIANLEELIDEVSALVEWPVVLVGEFDKDFLKVPQECLILTMQQNQKYFPLLDLNGKLTHQFLLVSNLVALDSSHIIHGNERVLRARLSDAQFFFEQDQKHRLETRLSRMANVVYHNQIGSQLQRVERLETLAAAIAVELGADRALAGRAARLAKADLMSDMVGEFPELQGVMGQYYARLDGEDAEVANAIEGHYHPRFAGDSLPVGPIATAVALADKLEILVGIYGIGLIPTGDKDPFGLRRQALGVLRILLENGLSLPMLLQQAADSFGESVKLTPGTATAVYGFMLERLKNYLANDFALDEIEAVLALNPERFNDVGAKLLAVSEFKQRPEAQALAAANKRIGNILKKAEQVNADVSVALFAESAEQDLWAAVSALEAPVGAAIKSGAYTDALAQLASVRVAVDHFFDNVMVNADDEKVRANRLALLARLQTLLNGVADISRLAA